jgi:hypothetical protein
MGTLMPLSPDDHRRHHPAAAAWQVPGPDGLGVRRDLGRGAARGRLDHRHLGLALAVPRLDPVRDRRAVRHRRLPASSHQPRREAKIDVAGICTPDRRPRASPCWPRAFGGSTWAWGSVEVITSYVVGTLFLVAFVLSSNVPRRGAGPAAAAVPQPDLHAVRAGVVLHLDDDVRGDHLHPRLRAGRPRGQTRRTPGLILMPLMVALVVVGILGGMIITRTGRYKELCVLGVVVMGVGYSLLTRMGVRLHPDRADPRHGRRRRRARRVHAGVHARRAEQR